MTGRVNYQFLGRLMLRAALTDIATRHPELTDCPRKDPTMTNNETPVVSVRIPQDLIDWLDAYAAAQVAAVDGMRFERSDAVRVLLTKSLAASTVKKPGKGKATK